jgi:hypothetical protein
VILSWNSPVRCWVPNTTQDELVCPDIVYSADLDPELNYMHVNDFITSWNSWNECIANDVPVLANTSEHLQIKLIFEITFMHPNFEVMLIKIFL